MGAPVTEFALSAGGPPQARSGRTGWQDLRPVAIAGGERQGGVIELTALRKARIESDWGVMATSSRCYSNRIATGTHAPRLAPRDAFQSVLAVSPAVRSAMLRPMRFSALFAVVLAGCASRSNVEVTPVVQADPFPDDCKVERIEGDCELVPDSTGERRLAVTCKNQPPRDRAVAHIYACMWDSEQVIAERLRVAACRAGGDTLFIEAELTDGCKEEDWDGKRSVPRGAYTVYRLKH